MVSLPDLTGAWLLLQFDLEWRTMSDTETKSIKRKQSTSKRILRGLGIVLLAFIVLLYLVFPVGMGVYSVLPGRQAVGEVPEGFEQVSLTSEDGISLEAWYRPPENGAAIILLHGAGASRESLRPYLSMLVHHGYGVLALDLRGHGASGGKTNRLGWQGTQDVGAAVDFLKGRSEIQAIGGLGLSMGGEALLGAAADHPEILAIAADGATRRSTAELLALESERPLVRNFTARIMYAAVQLLSGDPPPRPLLDSMLATESTRFLLIAAGGNALETAFNQLFARALGSRASLWIAPAAEHMQAFSLYPDEYEQRLNDFFLSELVSPYND